MAKTIGIVAVTAEGAANCYKQIVRFAGEQLGPNKHPEIILINPSFDTILEAQQRDDWQTVGTILTRAAQRAVAAGAEFIIIPANSVHFAYDQVAKHVSVPVLNLVEVVADECQHQGYKKVAVLGVGLTLSGGLYDQPLAERSIKSIELTDAYRKTLDSIIYNKLVHGIVTLASTKKVLSLCDELQRDGCEALILACTELPLILHSTNTPLPVLDSTEVLARAAVKLACS